MPVHVWGTANSWSIFYITNPSNFDTSSFVCKDNQLTLQHQTCLLCRIPSFWWPHHLIPPTEDSSPSNLWREGHKRPWEDLLLWNLHRNHHFGCYSPSLCLQSICTQDSSTSVTQCRLHWLPPKSQPGQLAQRMGIIRAEPDNWIILFTNQRLCLVYEYTIRKIGIQTRCSKRASEALIIWSKQSTLRR